MMRLRMVLFAIGAAGIAALVLIGASGLPPVGGYHGAYGEVLNSVAVGERKATDVVTAVNFDYRALDTLGEEFILFTSVLAVATVLRKQKDEREGAPEDEARSRAAPLPGDAVRILGVALVPITVSFGLCNVAHGPVSPGGGFQGGVVLASVPLVVYLCADVETFQRIAPRPLSKLGEAIGAAGYVLSGVLGLVLSKAFLENVLPLGEPADVFSSGTIFLLNLTVGLAVAAGFVELLDAFLEEALRKEPA
jgi:multicomponent Na+:H+ antiporter subunit B